MSSLLNESTVNLTHSEHIEILDSAAGVTASMKSAEDGMFVGKEGASEIDVADESVTSSINISVSGPPGTEESSAGATIDDQSVAASGMDGRSAVDGSTAPVKEEEDYYGEQSSVPGTSAAEDEDDENEVGTSAKSSKEGSESHENQDEDITQSAQEQSDGPTMQSQHVARDGMNTTDTTTVLQGMPSYRSGIANRFSDMPVIRTQVPMGGTYISASGVSSQMSAAGRSMISSGAVMGTPSSSMATYYQPASVSLPGSTGTVPYYGSQVIQSQTMTSSSVPYSTATTTTQLASGSYPQSNSSNTSSGVDTAKFGGSVAQGYSNVITAGGQPRTITPASTYVTGMSGMTGTPIESSKPADNRLTAGQYNDALLHQSQKDMGFHSSATMSQTLPPSVVLPATYRSMQHPHQQLQHPYVSEYVSNVSSDDRQSHPLSIYPQILGINNTQVMLGAPPEYLKAQRSTPGVDHVPSMPTYSTYPPQVTQPTSSYYNTAQHPTAMAYPPVTGNAGTGYFSQQLSVSVPNAQKKTSAKSRLTAPSRGVSAVSRGDSVVEDVTANRMVELQKADGSTVGYVVNGTPPQDKTLKVSVYPRKGSITPTVTTRFKKRQGCCSCE